MTIRIPCPACGLTQAVNVKTKPLRMWPHGSCVNVTAQLGTAREALERARHERDRSGKWLEDHVRDRGAMTSRQIGGDDDA